MAGWLLRETNLAPSSSCLNDTDDDNDDTDDDNDDDDCLFG